MNQEPSTEALLAGVEGFDLFAQSSPPDKAKQAAFTEDLELQARRAAGAAARLFETDDGKVVLEHLLDVSLRRPIWTAALGLAADHAYGHGILREGQNTLAWHILTLIAKGREEKQPTRGKEGL